MPIFISASLLEDFVSCSKRVYYRTNKPEQHIQSPEMVIGEVVHSAIERYWDNHDLAINFAHTELSLRSTGDLTSLEYADKCIGNYFSNFSFI